MATATPNSSQFSDTTTLSNSPAPTTWIQRNRSMVVGTAGALVTAGVGVAAYKWMDEPVQQFSQRNRSAIGNGVAYLVEPLGTAVPLHTTAAVFLTAGILTRNKKLRETAAVSLSSFYLNALVTTQLKKIFQRSRPSSTVENDEFEGPLGPGTNTSLPSSHTSNAFAVATAIASVYKQKRWVAPVAYGMASLVGLSRIYDNKHWASDVIAGAAVGYLSAKASLWGYRQIRNRIKARKLFVTPGWSNGSPTISAFLQF